MIPALNQNYTIEEINKVLGSMQNCINNKHRTFKFGEDRGKNVSFAQKYQLTTSDLDKIMLRINAMDFCGTLLSKNATHQNELLYVFAPKENLCDLRGTKLEISIYIKFCIEGLNKKQQTVIISFHELEYPISYAFK